MRRNLGRRRLRRTRVQHLLDRRVQRGTILSAYKGNPPISVDHHVNGCSLHFEPGSQAAVVDGASYWQRYWRIILPLTMPALVTTAVFTFINTYNDFFSQLIYLSDVNKMTVPVALRLFLDPSGGTSSFGGLFAMVLVSIGPVLGFFLASQRLLVRGIATTGLK